jgi:hypothetical protein
MILSGFERKRVERFAEFIDTASGRHRRNSIDDELNPLTQLTRRLQDLQSECPPEEEFRTALRSFLVAKAERDGVGVKASAKSRSAAAAAIDTAAWQAIRPSSLVGKTQPVRQVSARGSGRARLAVLAGVAAGAIVLSGVSAASTGALPGDPLYSVKRSAERAQLALAGSNVGRGRLYLDFARSRLAEAARVDPSRVGDVLADMNAETRHGVAILLTAAWDNKDQSAMTTVETFVSQQRGDLGRLTDAAAGGSGDRTVSGSLAVLTDINDRVNALRKAMAGGCSIQSVDNLGPKPATGC